MKAAVNRDSVSQTLVQRANAGLLLEGDFERRKKRVERDATFRQRVHAMKVEDTKSGESAGGKTRDSPLSGRDDLFPSYFIFE